MTFLCTYFDQIVFTNLNVLATKTRLGVRLSGLLRSARLLYHGTHSHSACNMHAQVNVFVVHVHVRGKQTQSSIAKFILILNVGVL